MAERKPRLSTAGAVNGTIIVIGGLALFALLILTFADVVTRNLFNQPIRGVQEISETWLMVILVSAGIWWSTVVRDHVRVTLLTEAVGPATFKLLEVVVTVVSVALLLRMAQEGFVLAGKSMLEGEYTGSYHTLVWPMRYVLAFALSGYALVLVVQLVNLLRGKTAPRETDDGLPKHAP